MGGGGAIWRAEGEIGELLGSRPPTIQAALQPPVTQATKHHTKRS